MMPGSDLLDEAFDLIDTQTIQYFQFASRTLNAVGQYVGSYAPPVDLQASVQPVNRTTYIQLGLDFQRNYYNVFLSEDVIDLQRGSAGDRFVWNGRILQCESETDVYAIDGWTEVLVVDVGPFNPATGMPA